MAIKRQDFKKERQRIGSILRRYRDARKLTLRALEAKSGVPTTTIFEIETGHLPMSIMQMEQFAVVLGMKFVREISAGSRKKAVA